MTGGAGNDIFIFRTVKEIRSDKITDFTTGDRVDLSGIDASQAEAGNQAFDFVGDTAFSGTAGELRYEALSDKLMLQGDVDGDGLEDFSIIMTGLTSLQTSDLIL
jgi:Ca2+-binding RTX toxin-like protein